MLISCLEGMLPSGLAAVLCCVVHYLVCEVLYESVSQGVGSMHILLQSNGAKVKRSNRNHDDGVG